MSWEESKALCFSLLCLMVSILTIGNVTGTNQCLQDEKEIKPRRFLQIENYIHEMTLETSGSTGHQLLTHAFKIFIEEILGFDSVKIIYHEDHYNASISLNRFIPEPEERVFGVRPAEQKMSVPETMINLGVWISRDTDLQDWSRQGYIESCGHVGFYGRFGWYIPRNTPLLLGNKDLPLDYWRTFVENPEVISWFALNPNDLSHASQLLQTDNGEYFCKETYCKNGMFTPEACSRGEVCATLLNSFPESSTHLPSQITSLDMKVQVMYLGPNLEKFAFSVHKKYSNSREKKGILFYSWNPTWLTSQLDPISVSFPGEMSSYYESAMLEKIVWGGLQKVTGAKFLHESTHRFSLNKEEYVSFLNLHDDAISKDPKTEISSIACSWMRENKNIWRLWKSSADVEKIPLYIGGIFPINGTYMDWGIVKAATMAVHAVNSNTSAILKGYRLELIASDGQCRADMVMKSFIDYIRHANFDTMAGILGPACSDTVEPLAGVATHFKTVVISYSAEGSTFSDREKYPYFFRTIGENKQYQHVYLALFKRLGWRRVASLTEEGQKYAEYVSHLQDLLQDNNISFIANRKFPREKPALNMSQYLQDLKAKKAKIIIGDFYDHAARAVMCEAFKQKMTAVEGYVWFLPTWFNDEWYDTDRHNGISGKEPIPCNTSEMIQAINGHLSLQHASFAPDDHIMQENITVKEWRQKYSKVCNASNVGASDYGGYAYDAVWTYAYALDELLKQNHSHITDLHSPNTTRNFVEIINNTDFFGVSGRIKFIGGPSRLSVIRVVQWIDRKKRIIGSFNPIQKNDSSRLDNEPLQLNKSSIVWLNPSNETPDDGTETPQGCVLETLANALDVSCEQAVVIVNVIGFGILGIILVVCFIVIKQRYDKRAKWTEDYFKSLGIDINEINVSALDKWEIPRDRVVINRKLGEGAFGTVYGGECFFDSKGWTAVAVKTLKVGSTLEQKLDFLSEAEVMKRFEHKNIIKLLGVCTKNEPVYTVMEFMLYGDLKTYLLARRHLVNEGDFEESDEISSKRLTAMTLDVARALSYLAELKYVHRDVACRNCLVNAFRTVKLGDFGMTRPMYESDYYRFNRKGMLPVRWMAPESLALGIFTPASDVWSFGVLLYEIITFGSFPFQGLSNNQVLDHVKGGNIITIPDGVKPQLEALLLSTWRYEGVKRPHASEIVEFLANNPRIISPCLDIPLASVQLEGSEVHEIQLPRKRPRKGLTINRANTSDTNSPGPVCPEMIPLTTTSTSMGHQSHNNIKSNTNQSQNHTQSSPYTTSHTRPHEIL